MSSFVAKQAGKAVFGDISNQFSSAVGSNQQQGAAASNINWADLNYPPCFRLFHYKSSELPTEVASVVRPMHWLFLATMIAIGINILDNIIIVCGGVTFYRILYSILNFFIFVPFAGYTFYEGYRAMALSDAKKLNWYMVYQSIMLVVYLIFAILPFGGFNGIAAMALRGNADNEGISSGIKYFWLICIIYEMVIFLFCAGLSGFNLYRAKTFNPYHSQEARAAAA